MRQRIETRRRKAENINVMRPGKGTVSGIVGLKARKGNESGFRDVESHLPSKLTLRPCEDPE